MLDTLTDRDLDAAVATEVMKKRIYHGPAPLIFDISLEDEGSWCGVPGYGMQPTTEECPHYSTDLAAAMQVQTETDRRNLRDAYADALMEACGLAASIFNSAIECNWYEDNSDGWDVIWAIANATPEQRCRATLQVVRAQKTKI